MIDPSSGVMRVVVLLGMAVVLVIMGREIRRRYSDALDDATLAATLGPRDDLVLDPLAVVTQAIELPGDRRARAKTLRRAARSVTLTPAATPGRAAAALDLAEALSDLEELPAAATLLRRVSEGEPDLVAQVHLRNRLALLHEKGDFREALTIYRLNVNACRALSPRPTHAPTRSLVHLANAMAGVGRTLVDIRDEAVGPPSAALRSLRQALRLYRRAGEKSLEFIALSEYVFASYSALTGLKEMRRTARLRMVAVLTSPMRRHLTVDHALDRCGAIADDDRVPRFLKRRVVHNIGEISATRGDLDALAWALETLIAIGAPVSDPDAVAKWQIKLADVLLEAGRLAPALDAATAAVDVAAKAPSRWLSVSAAIGLVETLSRAGRYDEALTRADDALERLGRKPAERVALLERRAWVYGEIGRDDLARSDFERAKSLLSAPRDAVHRALLDVALARTCGPVEGLVLLEAALRTFQQADASEPTLTCLEALSQAMVAAGRPEDALVFATRAWRLARATGATPDAALLARERSSSALLGRANQLVERHPLMWRLQFAPPPWMALVDAPFSVLYRVATVRRRARLRSLCAARGHSFRIRLEFLMRLAGAEMSAGRRRVALGYLQVAMREAELQRRLPTDTGHRMATQARVRHLYDSIVRVTWRWRVEVAFDATERSRARVLSDALASSPAWSEGAPADLIRRERELICELAALERNFDAVAKVPRRDAEAIVTGLSVRRRHSEEEYEQLRRKLRRGGWVLPTLTDTAPWSLKQVRESLAGSGTAVVEYMLTPAGTYVFAITDEGVAVRRLGPASAIASMVADLRCAVESNLHRYPHGHRLYRELVRPIASAVDGRRMRIVADGVLQNLPFGLLLTEPPDDREDERAVTRYPGRAEDPESRRARVRNAVHPLAPFDFSALEYLVRSAEFAFAPSATVAGIISGRAANRTYERDLIAFGDPVVDASGASRTGEQGARLEHAHREVWRVARMVSPSIVADETSLAYDDENVSLRLGAAATKSALAQATGRHAAARYLHFAVHAIAEHRRPELSALVFSPDGDDGYLRMYEILRISAPCDLVCLSACETAGGPISMGEGVVSLASAFLQRGARSVCASLWRVDDDRTADLMGDFYEALGHDQPSAALRQAQLRALERTPADVTWASFMVLGG